MPKRDPQLEREFRLLSWRADISPGFDAETLLREDLEAPYDINFEANKELGEDNRAATADLRRAVALLTVPTLLIHGSNDPRPPDGAEELARLLPHATLSLVDAGHLPWLETPDTIRSVLDRFLASWRAA
jgi:pimeloyl-ACP methyl ester carboxylesterase